MMLPEQRKSTTRRDSQHSLQKYMDVVVLGKGHKHGIQEPTIYSPTYEDDGEGVTIGISSMTL